MQHVGPPTTHQSSGLRAVMGCDRLQHSSPLLYLCVYRYVPGAAEIAYESLPRIVKRMMSSREQEYSQDIIPS